MPGTGLDTEYIEEIQVILITVYSPPTIYQAHYKKCSSSGSFMLISKLCRYLEPPSPPDWLTPAS